MDSKIKFDTVVEFLLRLFTSVFVGLVILDYLKPRLASSYIRLDIIFAALVILAIVYWGQKAIVKK